MYVKEKNKIHWKKTFHNGTLVLSADWWTNMTWQCWQLSVPCATDRCNYFKKNKLIVLVKSMESSQTSKQQAMWQMIVEWLGEKSTITWLLLMVVL